MLDYQGLIQQRLENLLGPDVEINPTAPGFMQVLTQRLLEEYHRNQQLRICARRQKQHMKDRQLLLTRCVMDDVQLRKELGTKDKDSLRVALRSKKKRKGRRRRKTHQQIEPGSVDIIRSVMSRGVDENEDTAVRIFDYQTYKNLEMTKKEQDVSRMYDDIHTQLILEKESISCRKHVAPLIQKLKQEESIDGLYGLADEIIWCEPVVDKTRKK